MIKNCYLNVLGRLQNPAGFTYIFAWNTKTEEYIVKRERLDSPTEDIRRGGGEENRRVMRDFDDLSNFYGWALSKGWLVQKALPLTHSV